MHKSFFTLVAHLIHMIDNPRRYPRPVKLLVTVFGDGSMHWKTLGRPPQKQEQGKVMFPVVKAEVCAVPECEPATAQEEASDA